MGAGRDLGCLFSGHDFAARWLGSDHDSAARWLGSGYDFAALWVVGGYDFAGRRFVSFRGVCFWVDLGVGEGG